MAPAALFELDEARVPLADDRDGSFGGSRVLHDLPQPLAELVVLLRPDAAG
jgi:hypothetical protein